MDSKPFRLPGVTTALRPARPLRCPIPPTDDMVRRAVALRPETPDDHAFLLQLFVANRAAEMLMLGEQWDRETKRDFLEKQFSYQYLHHSRFRSQADFMLILLQNRPVGRLYVDWAPDGRTGHLFDFLLAPDCRDKGIGSLVLAALVKKARLDRQAISLNVEAMSPARRLYSRFGFTQVSLDGAGNILMRWEDGPAEQSLRLAM